MCTFRKKAIIWHLQHVAGVKMEQDNSTSSQSPSQHRRAGIIGRKEVVMDSNIFKSPRGVLLENIEHLLFPT